MNNKFVNALFSVMLISTLTACGGSSSSNSPAPNDSTGMPDMSMDDPMSTPQGNSDDSVQYKVVFSTIWSSSTFATNFPSSPHFSPLVGMTHNAQTELWPSGGLATPGMEDMAETGATSILRSELEAKKQQGSVENIIQGSSFFLPTTSIEVTITVTKDFPLLSLVSMIAPSPDWFVGAKNIELLENDLWKESVTVQLLSYDAGTDDGLQYQSANDDSNPQGNIVRLDSNATDTDFADGVHRDTQAALGNFTITLLNN